MFEDVRPGGQLSAADLRRVGHLLRQARPGRAVGSPVWPFAGVGGLGAGSDLPDLFAARVTDVHDQYTPTRYGFVELWQDPETGAWEETTSARRSDGTKNWALAPEGETFAHDDVVLVRRHRRDVNLFEIVPLGGGGWELARVSAAHDGKPPRYTCVGVELAVNDGVNPPTFAYQDKSPAVTYLNCFRAPSRRWDELSGDHSSSADPVLRPIPVGQYVLVRQVIPPSDGADPPPPYPHDGAYELTPWGGTRGVNLEIPYRVCTQCVETSPGSGVYVLRTKMAIRKRSIYARDLRCLKKDPAKGEVNVEADVPNSGPEE